MILGAFIIIVFIANECLTHTYMHPRCVPFPTIPITRRSELPEGSARTECVIMYLCMGINASKSRISREIFLACFSEFVDEASDERMKLFCHVRALQATGAHPDDGMTPSQVRTLFERENVSKERFTREKLGSIIEHVEGGNGGLVRAQYPPKRIRISFDVASTSPRRGPKCLLPTLMTLPRVKKAHVSVKESRVCMSMRVRPHKAFTIYPPFPLQKEFSNMLNTLRILYCFSA